MIFLILLRCADIEDIIYRITVHYYYDYYQQLTVFSLNYADCAYTD